MGAALARLLPVVAIATALVALAPATAGAQRPGAAGDGGDFTWTVADRLVTRADGVPVYANSPLEVERRPFRADFRVKPERCDRRARYRWLVDGDEVAVLHGTCALQHYFDPEGEYDVRLETEGPAGARSSGHRVRIEDWLVVSIGDSVASGEGNPDRRRPIEWQERSCHRSGLAGPARAALALERGDPTTSVTFVHLACSGATVERGLLGPYAGIEPDRAGTLHDPQVAQLHEVRERARRDVDAVVLSVGANDAYFGPAAFFCTLFPGCMDSRFDPARPLRPPFGARRAQVMREVIRARVAELPKLYARLDGALGEELSERVHVVQYFDPTHRDADSFCRILGIAPPEAEFAYNGILRPLNAAIAAAAEQHEWALVSGAETEFREHGYCAPGQRGWVVRLERSLRLHGLTRLQTATSGTLHPNERGHQALALLILGSLTGELPEAAAEEGGEDERDAEYWGRRVLVGGAALAVLGAVALWLWRRWRRREHPAVPAAALGPPPAAHEDGPPGEEAAPPGAAPSPAGAAVLLLFNYGHRWVHRRVESVRFYDTDLVRRRVSVDFTLPRAVRPETADARAYVPLALLQKGPLTNFDLRDELGAPLPLLTTSQAGRLVFDELVAIAAGALAPGDDADALRALLWDVVVGDPQTAAERLGTIESDWPHVWAHAPLRGLVKTLAPSFLVIAPLYDARRRRVLKFAYDAPSRRETGRVERVLMSLGWAARRNAFPLPNVGRTGSYHFELAHEPDLEVAADIFAVDPESEERLPAVGTPQFAPAAHAYLPSPPPWSRGVARVWARVPRAGFLRGAPWIAVFTAVALTIAWFELPEIARDGKEVGPLILIVPTILAAYLGRPGEHPIASELLLGARVLLLAAGLASFAAAAVLALGYEEETLRSVIGAAAVAAWVAAAGLSLCWLGPAQPRPDRPWED